VTRTARAVEEVSFAIDVNGARVAHWTATPGQMRELTAGFLFAQGYIEGTADLLALDVKLTNAAHAVATVQVPDERMAEGERRRRERARSGFDEMLDGISREPGAIEPPEDLSESFRELFGLDDAARDTVGLHTAAAWIAGGLHYATHEIGRHNAVDKVIGAALIAHAPLESAGLLLTARVSGEIAFKAARARMAWIASRSVPTSLAVSIARTAGLVIVARAAGKERRVFRPHESD
jgi:FdhD protein